ncbi:MAG: hypothetical protein GY835_25360 [bacterium]|nr:hypothetical protein [bacterium]
MVSFAHTYGSRERWVTGIPEGEIPQTIFDTRRCAAPALEYVGTHGERQIEDEAISIQCRSIV